MSLEATERKELDTLWDKHDDLGKTVTQLSIQTSLLSQKVDSMNRELHESNGRLSGTLEKMVSEIRDLGIKVLQMTAAQQATREQKHHFVKDWMPLFVSVAALVVMLYSATRGGP